MAHVTQAAVKAHRKAEDVLWGSDKRLDDDQIEFVLQNWNPVIGDNAIGRSAFFTPLDLAGDLVAMALPDWSEGKLRIVDLCAGIGHLTYHAQLRYRWAIRNLEQGRVPEFWAIERSPTFVKVGRRLLPDVNWVEGSIFDLSLWTELGVFTCAISNPPFGGMAKGGDDTSWLRYKGPLDLLTAEVGLRVTRWGVGMILPRMNCPLEHVDGRVTNKPYNSTALDRFMKCFPYADFGYLSVDANYCRDKWLGTAPAVELADVTLKDDFRLTLDKAEDPTDVLEAKQLLLF